MRQCNSSECGRCQGPWSRELNSMQAIEQLLDRMEGKA